MFDQQVIAFGHDAAINLVVRTAAATQGQAAQGDVVGFYGEDGALLASVDHHLAFTFKSQRFADHGRPLISAGGEADGGTGEGGVEPGLEGLGGLRGDLQPQAGAEN